MKEESTRTADNAQFETNIEESNTEDTEIVEVELETVVQRAMHEFESVVSIRIGHPLTYEQVGNLMVTVYTGDADSFEDYRRLFSPDHKIVIDRDEERLLVPFTVMGTFDGPGEYDSVEQTTIYMDDNVLGAKPIELEDGLAYLQDKLEKPDQWTRRHDIAADRVRNYAE